MVTNYSISQGFHFWVWVGESVCVCGGGGGGSDLLPSDMNLSHLMCISIEGPNIESVNFNYTTVTLRLIFCCIIISNYVYAHIIITLIKLEGRGGMLLGRIYPLPYETVVVAFLSSHVHLLTEIPPSS